MTTIESTTTLAEIVTNRPAAARVLERHGLDYCCGGAQRLDAACAAAGIATPAVLAEIDEVEAAGEPDWAQMGPAALVDHIEATHHAYLNAELPRLSALADKVATVHGERHHELRGVAETFEALRADLEPHLRREESVLFPMIRELSVATEAPRFHCGSLANPIRAMLVDHDSAGELLEELRARSGGYAVPADGCASYRALYEGLRDLEADTHLHVHKENNVLFPAVLALEDRFVGDGSSV